MKTDSYPYVLRTANGQTMFVDLETGIAYGPADLLPGQSGPIKTAAEYVCLFAGIAGIADYLGTTEEDARRFCAQAPDGPQPGPRPKPEDLEPV